MLLWSNLRYPFFYIFVHNRSFLVMLPNFTLLLTLQREFFGPLFPKENLAPPLIFLVPILGWKLEKMTSFSQKYTRIEIIITISRAIRKKKNKNFGPCIRAIFHIYSYYNLIPCGIFEKMTSFSPIFNQELEQGKLMAALNSPSEIKVQKTRVVMSVIEWNLARLLGKTYCVRKCKKLDIENLIIVAL